MDGETWYVVIDRETGELRGCGTVLPPALAPGLVVREYDERPDQGGVIWSAELRAFVPNPRADVEGL